MKKFFGIIIAAIFLFGGAARICPAKAEETPGTPKEVVRNLIDRAMAINNEKIGTLEKEQKFSELAKPNFNVSKMLEKIVGKKVFAGLDPRRKEFLLTRFRDNVICKVTGCCESRVDFKDIKSASGYKFTKQGRVDGDYAEETVILSIVQADKLSVRFMLALEDNVWKVYDMECMGLYLSDAYKQAFEEERSNVDNFSNVLFQEVDKSRQRLVQE